MSAFNGSGTFVISGSGLPFVTNTTISSTVGNQLNTDLASGLSNVICKDGQTVITNNIPMAGFKLTGLGAATTSGDALSYGNPITAAAIIGTSLALSGGIAQAFGTAGSQLACAAFTQTDSTTAGGTVATAYGSLHGAATFATAGNGVTITNAYNSYFEDPVAGAHVSLTNKYAIGTDTLKCIGNSSFGGVLLGAAATFTGSLQQGFSNGSTQGWLMQNAASGISGLYNTTVVASSSNYTLADDASTTYINAPTAISLRIANSEKANISASTFTIGEAITYGGVTLNNAVTGTGNMVLSAAPTISGAVQFTGAPTVTSGGTTNFTVNSTVNGGAARILLTSKTSGGSAVDYRIGTELTTDDALEFTRGAALQLLINATGTQIASGKTFQLGNAYVATPQVTSGYVTIQDSTGTNYKVLVAA